MCTAIILQSKSNETFLGRNMDFSHDIVGEFFKSPPCFVWKSSLDNTKFQSKYGFIACGQKLQGLTAFFDGVNEKGFAAAALYFAGYAKYNSSQGNKGKKSVASIDFIRYILGECATIEDLTSIIKSINIIGFKDPLTNSVAPLHWIVTDKSGKCLVVEPRDQGVEIINNPLGVMANSSLHR